MVSAADPCWKQVDLMPVASCCATCLVGGRAVASALEAHCRDSGTGVAGFAVVAVRRPSMVSSSRIAGRSAGILAVMAYFLELDRLNRDSKGNLGKKQ